MLFIRLSHIAPELHHRYNNNYIKLLHMSCIFDSVLFGYMKQEKMKEQRAFLSPKLSTFGYISKNVQEKNFFYLFLFSSPLTSCPSKGINEVEKKLREKELGVMSENQLPNQGLDYQGQLLKKIANYYFNLKNLKRKLEYHQRNARCIQPRSLHNDQLMQLLDND